MGRCKKCYSCLFVHEFKNNNKGKQNLKKYKRFDTANPCTNPTAKRARISETKKLFAGGHGGEIKGEIQPVPSVEEVTLERADHKARPKESLKEDDPFDQEAFDEYLDLVNKCTKKAKQSTPADVKAEASSMIRKMRGLLHPSMRSEVDYAEATKDTSNILVQWSHGYAAGAKAFIPDLGDRDLCYAALKILSCAAEEAKQMWVNHKIHQRACNFEMVWEILQTEQRTACSHRAIWGHHIVEVNSFINNESSNMINIFIMIDRT